MLSVVLAVIDAVAGAYLIRYAIRREHRDKDGVLAVGYFLLVCSLLLMAIEVLPQPEAPTPVGPGTSRV